ncbi:MAG: glycoside hydrolase TIM-barrel-like domain-containing protein [Pseudomonadota bacterium]
MATVLLAAAGNAVGSAIGGQILGMSAATIGQAAGAVAGSFIDQALLGQGSAAVDVGRARGLRLQSATEGAAMPLTYGRMRIAGQVIWSTRFLETVRETTQGGKATGGGQTVREHSYSISMAVAVGEGPIDRIGRIWADGAEMDLSAVTYRVYRGTEDQGPDPKIEAVEGAGNVPGYPGTAYVVFEDLALGPYGNRIPQLNMEVFRGVDPEEVGLDPAVAGRPLKDLIQGVALSPGTGEFTLHPEPYRYREGGSTVSANVSTNALRPDLKVSLDQLQAELPNVTTVSLIVSWFGDDLRCGRCTVTPRVERAGRVAQPTAWSVAGLSASTAMAVSTDADERPIFGGTPDDRSVIAAIQELKARGYRVLMYPFLLMDIPQGNGLTDPWSGAADQPPIPWRGRITLEAAPGQPGSADQTAAAADEVAAFFGTATAADFSTAGSVPGYSGPVEWGWRRFVLHLAALSQMAGGVDAFCLGSELRSLTQVRSDRTTYPAVEALRDLGGEVRALLPDTLLSYAADWSEYWGHQPDDGTGDRLFHLDPLWADPEIDFVGIDDYMSAADWRHTLDHADAVAGARSVYDLAYLKANIAGGENYDWYYASEADRAAQVRTPIADGYVEPANQAPAGTPDYALGLGSGVSFSTSERQSQMVLRVSLTMPATLSDGLIFEAGGSGRGLWLGLRDGGATLRLRAGDGGALPDNATAVLDVPAAALAGQSVELMAWIERPGDRVHLYADGVSLGSESAPSGFGTNEWAGSNGSTVGTGAGASITTGEPADPFPGTIDGPVEIWIGQAPVVGAGAPLGEDWIYRPKDLVGWWGNAHHNRVDGLRSASATAWVPGSKPIWLTETGCPAVDLGANKPNLFLDDKSSESALPPGSTGARDDEMQRRFLQAKLDYWADPANNPVSGVYGGSMLPADRVYVWTWDARPWPDFPNRTGHWSDGPNHRRGHWLTGRVTASGLAEVVASLCLRAGIEADVSDLYGVVQGYTIERAASAREALQALMTIHGFDAFESGGRVAFRMRLRGADQVITRDGVIAGREAGEAVNLTRGARTEAPARVRLSFVDAETDFRPATAEVARQSAMGSGVQETGVNMALPGEVADTIASRMLAESAAALDTLELSLAPSSLALEPGDVVSLDGEVGLWRLDRAVREGGLVEAVFARVDRGLYLPRPGAVRSGEAGPAPVPGPVEPIILDLPVAEGSSVDHQPFVAVAARPWPGTVSVVRDGPAGFEAMTSLLRPAVIGHLVTALPAGAPDLWHRVGAEVEVSEAGLSSATQPAVLNGANRLAVEVSDGAWEVLQFEQAVLIGADRYRLSGFLRGQRGTEALAAMGAPSGARVVLLDSAVEPLPIQRDAVGLPASYRIGPARYAPDHESWTALSHTPLGLGERPFAPARAVVVRGADGWRLTWLRRTRIGGDTWEGADVPLGETREAYVVRVLSNGAVLREVEVTETVFDYTDAMAAADGATAPFDMDVAQLSETWGPGLRRSVRIDG